MDNRAQFTAVDEAALAQTSGQLSRRSRFRVREQRVAEPGGADIINIYGDKNQYFKLATLFTHLGLILFLGAAALDYGVRLRDGRLPRQGPDGACPGRWARPTTCWSRTSISRRPSAADGSFLDFSTDLAVYQNGVEVARKTIEVNDPLEFDGYAFHQNTFGPAETMQITDPSGALVWDGPILLDGALAGSRGLHHHPGSDLGLLLVLNKADDGSPVLALTGITQDVNAGQTNIALSERRGPGPHQSARRDGRLHDHLDGCRRVHRNGHQAGPGQGLVWVAYLSLITGLVLSFYFPRRRFWARFENGKLQVAMLADRYVDTEREFDHLVESIGKSHRRPAHAGARGCELAFEHLLLRRGELFLGQDALVPQLTQVLNLLRKGRSVAGSGGRRGRRWWYIGRPTHDLLTAGVDSHVRPEGINGSSVIGLRDVALTEARCSRAHVGRRLLLAGLAARDRAGRSDRRVFVVAV